MGVNDNRTLIPSVSGEGMDGVVTDERKSSNLTFLPAQFAALFHNYSNVDELLSRSMTELMSALPGSASASLYLSSGDGKMMLTATCRACPNEGTVRERPELAAQVMEYIKPITVVVPGTSANLTSILGVPVKLDERALGALLIATQVRVYSDDDIALLNQLAGHIAYVIAKESPRNFGAPPARALEHYAL